MAVYELKVDHYLPMIQPDLDTNIFGYTVTDFLGLSDIARTQYIDRTVKSIFNVGHTIQVRTSVYNLQVTDYLDLNDRAGRTYRLEIIQGFYPYQVFRDVEYEALSDALTLSHSLQGINSKGVSNTITFGQNVAVISIRNISFTQVFAMQSNQNGYIADKYSYSIVIPSLSGPNAPEC